VLGVQIPVQHPGFPSYFEYLLLQSGDFSLQLDGGGLDDLRLYRLGDHQQQNDRAEATADDVEERQ
jgi:hypothetical protein